MPRQHGGGKHSRPTAGQRAPIRAMTAEGDEMATSGDIQFVPAAHSTAATGWDDTSKPVASRGA